MVRFRASRAVLATFTAALLATTAVVPRAAAQSESQQREYGALVGTFVAMDCRDVPARAAIAALSRLIDTTIVVHARDAPDERGLDADAPVTITTPGAPARIVLESILDQAAEFEPVTWQLREHWIEVGTKHDLAARRAAERRLVNVDDDLIEPPYFLSPRERVAPLAAFWENPYHVAAITIPTESGRKPPERLLREMVRLFVDTVEPGNWNYGQYADGSMGPIDAEMQRALRDRRVAEMTMVNGRLLVVAPEFMHRAISGPPEPILPPRIGVDERAARAEAATAHGVRAWIVDDIGAPPESEDEWSWAQRPRQALRDALEQTPVTLTLAGAPAREAFTALARQLPFALRPRWDDDRLGFGLDPRRPVTIDTTESGPAVSARAVLEDLLAQTCDEDDPGRWQVRLGYVEAGPRTRLSVPAAARTELHYTADLTLHVPDGFEPAIRREILAVELVERIVTSVEPDLWDWGQLPETVDADLAPVIAARAREWDDEDADEKARRDDGEHRSRPREQPQWVSPARPATIRYWRDYLIVHAPGFVHRQLGPGESERGGRR